MMNIGTFSFMSKVRLKILIYLFDLLIILLHASEMLSKLEVCDTYLIDKIRMETQVKNS